jgi:hypothetical protein
MEGLIMRSDELSVKERAALFALLAEARQLSNPELEERVGFRLDGKERRKLNDLKLVESVKPGRAYEHELTDKGWTWCAKEFSTGSAAAGDNMERALYAILGGLDRYMHGTGKVVSDIFNPRYDGASAENGSRPGRIEPADVESSILNCYSALASKPGEFVKLSDLRGQLADMPRRDTDAALGEMYRNQRVNLIPQSNQLALTADDRASALHIGGEDKHLISVRTQ